MNNGIRDVCKECDWAKYRQSGACYCTKHGIIIGYPKMWCVGFEERKEHEQVREQEVGERRQGV